MTVIVGAILDDSVVLVSDSRATITTQTETVSSDDLQKIVGIDKSTIVAFATNDINATNIVLKEFQYFNSSQQSTIAEKLNKLEGLSKAALGAYQAPFSLLVALKSDGWELYSIAYPDFKPEKVSSVSVKGSGSFIADELERFYHLGFSPDLTTKQKSDALVRSMMELLNGPNSSSVGGLPQVLILDESGVRTVHTGYVDFSPEGEPDSKEIRYSNGHWVQRNGSNESVILIPPDQLSNKELSRQVFHTYEKSIPKETKWYVNSFGLFKDFGTTPTETDYGFRLGSVLSLKPYPTDLGGTLYISAFGPGASHTAEVTLINPGGREQTLLEETFENTKFPHEFEFIQEVNIHFARRGKHFLVLKMNGKEVARKVIYAYEQRSQEPLPEVQERMTQFLNGYSDPAVKPSLTLFTLSRKEPALADGNVKVTDQFVMTVSKNFPMTLLAAIFIEIQANPGEHEVKIDFIDAFDRSVIFEVAMTNNSTSLTNVLPFMFAKVSLTFPHPGFYFIRTFVDGVLLGAIPLFSDSFPASITNYEITQDSVSLLEKGEALLLAKRTPDN